VFLPGRRDASVSKDQNTVAHTNKKKEGGVLNKQLGSDDYTATLFLFLDFLGITLFRCFVFRGAAVSSSALRCGAFHVWDRGASNACVGHCFFFFLDELGTEKRVGLFLFH
jgi:hypothetical protein